MENKKSLLRFLLLSIILLTILFIVPYTINLSLGGFEDSNRIDIWNIYTISGLVGYILIALCFLFQLILTKDDKKYGSSIAFSSIGEKPSISFFKRFTAPQLIILSLIIFSSIFLFANVSGVFIKSLTGLRVLPQQFTPTSSLIYSSAMIPVSENLVAGAVLAVCLVFLGYFARKYKLSSFNWYFLCFCLVLIIGLFGVVWHLSVYPDSETALITVFFFWTSGSFLCLMTGFYGVFWVVHILNNLFVDLQRFLSSESIVIWIGISIFILIVLYIIIYRKRLLGKKGQADININNI